jgi:4-hydroxybenzoyl-CoA thioesterase/acyl-CoA thioester hydrolase
MPAPFVTSRRVEFRDTDAAGIMHFASIMGVMEEAEHEFLRHIDLPLFLAVDRGKISWPRVSASCDFKSPAHFEDILEIAVSVQRIGKRSVTYQFHVVHDGQTVANGNMTAACCLVRNGKIEAIQVPEDVVAKLTQYLVRN